MFGKKKAIVSHMQIPADPPDHWTTYVSLRPNNNALASWQLAEAGQGVVGKQMYATSGCGSTKKANHG
jgi:hypothetical protein